MSIHKSLSAKRKGAKKKNVLTRYERIQLLIEKGLWKEGNKPFGLPKK